MPNLPQKSIPPPQSTTSKLIPKPNPNSSHTTCYCSRCMSFVPLDIDRRSGGNIRGSALGSWGKCCWGIIRGGVWNRFWARFRLLSFNALISGTRLKLTLSYLTIARHICINNTHQINSQSLLRHQVNSQYHLKHQRLNYAWTNLRKLSRFRKSLPNFQKDNLRNKKYLWELRLLKKATLIYNRKKYQISE